MQASDGPICANWHTCHWYGLITKHITMPSILPGNKDLLVTWLQLSGTGYLFTQYITLHSTPSSTTSCYLKLHTVPANAAT